MKYLLTFSERLAKKAGAILLDYKKKIKVVKQKDIADITTNADLASEKFLITEIQKRFPAHQIQSEEAGKIGSKSDYCWIIDPLDGTKEYIRGIPLYNVSIALEYKNETILSCVYRPSENTLYSSAKGLGSFKDSNKIKVSSIKSLEKSVVYCYLPSYFRNKKYYDWAFEKLSIIGKRVYRLRALADENTALCWLAQGGCEAYINISNPPQWHDIVPGILIAKEAGACITNKIIKNISKQKLPILITNNQKIKEQIENVFYK